MPGLASCQLHLDFPQGSLDASEAAHPGRGCLLQTLGWSAWSHTVLWGRHVLCWPPQPYPREHFPAGTRLHVYSCCLCHRTAFLEMELCCTVCPQPTRVPGAFGECTYLETSDLLYSLHQAPPPLNKSCCFFHLHIRKMYFHTSVTMYC